LHRRTSSRAVSARSSGVTAVSSATSTPRLGHGTVRRRRAEQHRGRRVSVCSPTASSNGCPASTACAAAPRPPAGRAWVSAAPACHACRPGLLEAVLTSASTRRVAHLLDVQLVAQLGLSAGRRRPGRLARAARAPSAPSGQPSGGPPQLIACSSVLSASATRRQRLVGLRPGRQVHALRHALGRWPPASGSCRSGRPNGASSRLSVVRQVYSVWCNWSACSAFQKRRRLRCTYQFDSSSTNASSAWLAWMS
jgi:hypothetical protein